MKSNTFKPLWQLCMLMFCLSLSAQPSYDYEPSKDYPFGRPNPKAPQEIKDWQPLIGNCECSSVARNPDQTWAEPVQMEWTFKYIMNGWGIQDETLKADGGHSGSIRQFIADSSRWYVHYYSNKGGTPVLPAWEGGKRGDSIVLYRPQTAPNGMEGFYRITFSDMTEEGFKWLGEWVDPSEQIRFPTWKINCRRKIGSK